MSVETLIIVGCSLAIAFLLAFSIVNARLVKALRTLGVSGYAIDRVLSYCVFDQEGRLYFLSPKAEVLLRYSNKNAQGRDIYALFPVKEHKKIRRLLRSLSNQAPWSGMLSLFEPPNQQYFQAQMEVSDDNATIYGVLYLFDASTARASVEQDAELGKSIDRLALGAAIVENHYIVHCNSHLESLLNCFKEELLGKHIMSLFDASCAKKHMEKIESDLKASASARIETEICCPDGELVWSECLVSLSSEHGQQIWLMKDATASKSVADEARQASIVFESANDGILILDANFVVTMCNPAMTRMTQFDSNVLRGKKLQFLGASQHKSDFYNALNQQLQATGSWQGEMWQRNRDNSVFPVWLSVTCVKDETGAVVEYVGISTDMTERKKSERRIVYQANYDALTGLPNRHFCMEKLQEAIKRVKREGTMLAFLYLDLDRFKSINESLGHSVGDKLLKKVSEILSTCQREHDTLARFGGDEFALIVNPIYGAKNAATVAQNIIDNLSKSIIVDGLELIVGASVGISVFPDDGDSSEDLWKNADIAMYKAKEQGRNNFQFFTHSLLALAEQRLAMERELRQALEKNELFLNYQPQYGFQENTAFGVEVLLRWQSPERGLVSPAQFVPIAEDTGLIVPIGEWVLKTACRQYKQWQQQSIAPAHIAINVSGRQFCADDFVSTILRVLSDENVPAENIELELTESILMDDEERVINTLNELRTLGFKLSIDDFGTGYSSLSYLKRFPIDTLKVDQSFVRETPENAEDAAIVKTIIDMAHTLNMSVIAEGVEKESQLYFLQQIGCDVIQGYHYSRPLDAKTCTEFMLREFSQEQVH